jgi:hypothetical protein
MDGTQILIIGTALAFNVLVIKYKLEKHRISDAILDGSVLIALSLFLGSTLGGMQIATVASAIVSIYLWFYPPKMMLSSKQTNKIKKHIKPKNKIKL